MPQDMHWRCFCLQPWLWMTKVSPWGRLLSRKPVQLCHRATPPSEQQPKPWSPEMKLRTHTIFALHVLKKGVTKQVQFQSYRNRTSHFFQSYLRLRKWEFLCMLSHSSNAHDRIVPRSETRSWELHPSLPEVSGSQLFRQSLLPPGSVMQNNLVSRSQMWSEARQSNVGVGVPTCVTTSRLNALYNTKFIFLTFISWKVQRWDQDGRTAGKATVQEYFHPKWALVQNQAAPHPIQLPSSGLAKASEDDLVAWGPVPMWKDLENTPASWIFPVHSWLYIRGWKMSLSLVSTTSKI